MIKVFKKHSILSRFQIKSICLLLCISAISYSLPELKFSTGISETEKIEAGFKSALNNLINLNSIDYKVSEWNETGLMETASGSQFLRAAPQYGVQPWVRDGSFNTWSAMNLLEANDGKATHTSRNTLWALCDKPNGKLIIEDDMTKTREWYDKIIWAISAWNYFTVTGDSEFLGKAYEAVTNTFKQLEGSHFNTTFGLFEGSSFISDGISAFPEPPFNWTTGSSNAADYPETKKAMCLSTNCIYVGAYKAAIAMATELGKSGSEIDAFNTKAQNLIANINKHMWIPNKGLYGYFIHGKGTQKEGTLDESQEGSGISYAIVLGVADSVKTRQILQNVHRAPKGITYVWPHFKRFSDDKPGRHNVSVWPQICGLFSHAATIGGRIDLFQSEVENVAGLFKSSADTIFEIYHYSTGKPFGGYQMNNGKMESWYTAKHQAWGAGGFCRAIFYGLFGMQFEPDSINFRPTLPSKWGEVSLNGLVYRNMILNVNLTGSGKHISAFKINGQNQSGHFVSAALTGEVKVDIKLSDSLPVALIKSQAPIRSFTFSIQGQNPVYSLSDNFIRDIRIFSLNGHQISVIPSHGNDFVWSGRDQTGKPLARGIYLIRLTGDKAIHDLKVSLLQ